MSEEAKQDVCFVVSPIGQKGSEARIHADWVLKGIIEPAFKVLPDFHIERSDHISTPGQINAQVIDRLLNCRLVIADLSMLNPNVFYEIGIRHMVEKPIIHLQRDDDAIPFDVAIYRAVKFSLKEHSGLEAAQGDLAKAIREVLDPAYVTNNPVTEARGRVKLKENATPEQQILLEDMASIKSRLAYLEAQQSLHSKMIDPTISIPPPNHVAASSKNFSRWIDLKRHVSPLTRGDVATISINTTKMPDHLIHEIVQMIRREGRNLINIRVGNSGQGIEVDGQLDDMRRLAEILGQEEEIGDRNITIDRY